MRVLGFLLGFATLVLGVRLIMAAPHVPDRVLEGVLGFVAITGGVSLLAMASRRRLA